MLHRFGRKIIIRSALTLAYSVVGVDTISHTPLWIVMSIAIIFSITASFAKLEPFTWDKTALQISQSAQVSIQAMHTAHMFGDSLTAERIYLNTLPAAQQTNTSIQLRNAAYPQEKLEQLRTFWTTLLAKQPSSREAYAALTAIHQSLHETEAIPSTLEVWMFIEPNDPRLVGVMSLTK